MAKPTCIACKGAGGGVSEDKIQQMIDTSIEGKQDILIAGYGIDISDENTISLEDFKIETTRYWGKYIDSASGSTICDIIIRVGATNFDTGMLLIPKGFKINEYKSFTIASSTGNILINQKSLFNNGVNVAIEFFSLDVVSNNVDGTFTVSRESGTKYVNKSDNIGDVASLHIALYYRGD